MKEIYINPLPKGVSPSGVLYPDGAHLTDLTEVRALCYQMQRPGIAPHVRLSFYEHHLLIMITARLSS